MDNGQTLAISIGVAASRVGGWLGSFVGGWLLACRSGWRGLLHANSALAAAMMLMGLLGLSEARPMADNDPVVSTTEESNTVKKPSRQATKALGLCETVRIVATTPKLLLLYGSNTMLVGTFNFGTLLPQFLSEEYTLDDVSIWRIAGAFPLGSAPVAI